MTHDPKQPFGSGHPPAPHAINIFAPSAPPAAPGPFGPPSPPTVHQLHPSLADVPDDGCEIYDAYVVGPLVPALLERNITIALGGSEQETAWTNKTMAFRGLAEALCKFQRGPKNGLCMLQGELAASGGRRSSTAMRAIHVIIFDVDNGTTIAELSAVLPGDMCAIFWTTHSHNKTRTLVNEKQILQWLQRESPEPTAAEAVQFLIAKKKAKPEIFEGASLGARELAERGAGYWLTHRPWPKLRVLLPLEKPFVFLERGGTHDQAISEWKAKYKEAAVSLGIEADPACADPGRLFFTPRIAPDAPLARDEVGAADVYVQPGKRFDLDSVQLPLKVEKTASVETAPHEGFKTRKLSRFLAVGASSFRAADWLRDIAPNDVRHEYSGGLKIDARCPMEDGHTDPSDDDRGFYAANGAGDTAGFQLYCPHQTCLGVTTRNSKHDRGVMLDEACAYYGVADAAGLLEWCDDAARAAWDSKADTATGFSAEPGARPLLDPNDPLPSAREFLKRYTRDGLRTLHHYNDDFVRWDGTAYTKPGGRAIRAELWNFLGDADRRSRDGSPIPFKPTLALVTNVEDALRSVTHLSPDVSAPSWIGQHKNNYPPVSEFMPCANGLLHLPTRKLWQATPAFFNFNALPYPYDADAPTPVEWLKFLQSIWPDDPESVLCLRQWLGLCLIADTSYHKIMLLYGPKRSGKGTIGRLLEALLGSTNVASPTFASLATDFGLQPLIGKRAAIISDARLDVQANHQVAIERLLVVSGEDPVDVPRKHRESWHGRLSVRVTVLTNELPRLLDDSGAIASRFVVLKTTQTFDGREDRQLEGKLRAELPGILLWALWGLSYLNAWGTFTQPKTGEEATRDLKDLGSPINAFLRDMCEVGPNKQVGHLGLYQAYCDWCHQQGSTPAKSGWFGRGLRTAVSNITDVRPQDGASRERYYSGVALKSPNR